MDRSEFPNLDFIARTGDPTPGTKFNPKLLAEELKHILDFADAADRRATYMERQVKNLSQAMSETMEKLHALEDKVEGCPHCTGGRYPLGFYP